MHHNPEVGGNTASMPHLNEEVKKNTASRPIITQEWGEIQEACPIITQEWGKYKSRPHHNPVVVEINILQPHKSVATAVCASNHQGILPYNRH